MSNTDEQYSRIDLTYVAQKITSIYHCVVSIASRNYTLYTLTNIVAQKLSQDGNIEIVLIKQPFILLCGKNTILYVYRKIFNRGKCFMVNLDMISKRLNLKLTNPLLSDLNLTDGKFLHEGQSQGWMQGLKTEICNYEQKHKAEKLQCQMDQTKAQLNIMQASLSESKSYNENLSIICSQLESNQTALNLALEKANQIKEANDALLILIETQLAVFLANYRLSEAVDQELSMESLKDECQKLNVVSKMQRKRAVTVAMETLNKFNEHEHLLESNGIFEDKSSKDIFECEEKLKGHINRLQCEKDKIMATLLPVSTSLHDIIDKNSFPSESVTFSCNEEEGALGSDITKNLNSSAKTLNLENAIMQQELTKLKEERTDLRAQIFMIQKERELYVLTLLAKETELEACRIQNNYLSRKIENGNQIDKTSNVNHLVRKFTQTLDKLSAQIDYKSRQTETYISELKQANQSLLETIGKIRIKYEKESQRLKTEYKIKCNALESKVNDLQFTINSMIEKTAKKMYVNGQNVKRETIL